MIDEKVIVIDFGGQYNQLVARRVRECNVYCEIFSYKMPLKKIKEMNPKGIILTGGPNSCYEEGAPSCGRELFEMGIPVLGLCYGAQLMQHVLGGKVEKAPVREYGKTEVDIKLETRLFEGIPKKTICWMSHFDYISKTAPGFEIIAHTNDCPVAAAMDENRQLYAIQFHPEVLHTVYGKEILYNFVRKICACSGAWRMDSFVEESIKSIREKVGDGKVLLALSGGVDSSVAAGLLSRAIGKQLTCVFIDHGLLRKNEGDEVEAIFGSGDKDFSGESDCKENISDVLGENRIVCDNRDVVVCASDKNDCAKDVSEASGRNDCKKGTRDADICVSDRNDCVEDVKDAGVCISDRNYSKDSIEDIGICVSDKNNCAEDIRDMSACTSYRNDCRESIDDIREDRTESNNIFDKDGVLNNDGRFDLNFIRVNAQERYYEKLADVIEPEKKRKIIGEEFIRIFEEESKKIGAVDFLAQGTIYPDVVESGLGGESSVIKSHHNVGGLPDYVDFKEIIEPLRNLFKDEVRQVGLELGLPESLVFRQPFPGPGLGVRIVGEITAEKVSIVQDADYIYREEVLKAYRFGREDFKKLPDQYFAALTNMRSVGVMGDERTYDYAIALRAVETIDFMTAEASNIPFDVLQKVMSRIINEVGGVNRVLYDLTSKPPGTVEFE